MGTGDRLAGGAASPTAAGGVDFFVSYTGADQVWAEWVAWQLEAAGYSTRIQAWDFGAGRHFVTEMHRTARDAARTVAVLSAAYLSSAYAEGEWQAAWAGDPTGRAGKLLVVRIEDCARPGLLGQLVGVDLFGVDRATATGRLVAAACGDRGKPAAEPLFPGGPSRPVTGASAVEPMFPGRLPEMWGPVPARNLLFTGRDEILADLHARLSAEGRGAVAGLQGFAGVGKTQLAVEYAWRYPAGLDLVWWVDAETSTGLAAGLAALAGVLGVGEGEVPTAARAALAELGRRKDWLLVYDNIPDPATLAAMLPPTTGRLLVTSRDPMVRRVGVDLVEVGEFTRPESIDLLRRHLPGLPDAPAGRLAGAVGDLPLAVEQAGAYLAETGMPPEVYLIELANTPDMMLDGQTLHHPGLARTVTLAAARLAASSPPAAALLDRLMFLAPEPIPLTSAAQPVAGALVAGDPRTTHEALGAISRLVLARRSGTTLRLHRLVLALLLARLTPTQAAEAFTAALRLLATARLGDPENPADWPAYAALTPHVTAAASHAAALTGVAEPDGFRRLLAYTCWYLVQAGQFRAVRDLATPTRHRWTARPGPDHPDTLRITTSLAAAHSYLGDHRTARALDEDTLARRRRLFGDDHPDTLRSAGNLAVRLAALGDVRGARALDEDTLARRRRLFGDDHPDTLRSAYNLGIRLDRLGDVAGARALDEDTLARRRRVLGDDHPHTLRSAGNLALRLAALGDPEAARALAEDTLARMRRVLGDDHPHTLNVAGNLARELAAAGELTAAGDGNHSPSDTTGP